jgi:hypothetical protein
MAQFKITVVKGGDLIEVDTDKLPEEVYEEALLLGLKHLVNAKMTKVTKAALPEDDERKASAMQIAAENVEAMYAGKIRFMARGKAKTKGQGKGAVTTLARQYAKALVKEEIKRQGLRVSHIEAKEITRLANEVLEDEEQGGILLAKAEAELAARAEGALSGLNLKFVVSEKKVKQAEGKTERAKKEKVEVPAAHVISAQAGRTGPQVGRH